MKFKLVTNSGNQLSLYVNSTLQHQFHTGASNFLLTALLLEKLGNKTAHYNNLS